MSMTSPGCGIRRAWAFMACSRDGPRRNFETSGVGVPPDLRCGEKARDFSPIASLSKTMDGSRNEIRDENISLHPLPKFDLLRECTLSQLRSLARILAQSRPHGRADPESRRALANGASRSRVAGLSPVREFRPCERVQLGRTRG